VTDDANTPFGWAYKGSWTIINHPPLVGAITPASGSANVDQQILFTTTFADSDGAIDLKYCLFLINTAINGVNCFYAYYDHDNNKFFLLNDTATSWLGGFTPGSNNSIENSFVKLDCAKSTVTIQGQQQISVTWAVTFKPSFTGQKKTYLYAMDESNATSGWVEKGSFKISLEAIPPTGTIKINNDAQYTNSTTVTLNLSASDNAGGSGLSQMQFSNDNSNWSTPETYSTTKTWLLISGDGTKTVYVKFSDKAGNWSEAFSDTIILDTPPTVTINPVTSPTNIDNQIIAGTKSPDATEITVISSALEIGPVSFPTPTTWRCLISSFIEGDNLIKVKAKDAFANTSPEVQATIKYTPSFNISQNIQITNSPNNEENPSIAMFDNIVYAIWQNSSDGKVYFDKSNDAGLTWNVLRRDIATGVSPRIKLDASGNLYIVWQDANTVYFVKSVDGGKSFTNKIAVGSGYSPDIAVAKSGNIVYVVSRDTTDSLALTLRKSTDAGITFNYTANIKDTKAAWLLNYQPKVNCSESGRDVYVLFTVHYNPGAIGLYHRDKALLVRSSNYGLIFESPKLIAPEEHNSYFPDISTYSNNKVYIAWEQDNNLHFHNYLIKSADSGASFSAWQRIDDGDYYSTQYTYPVLAIDENEHLYTAFLNETNRSLCFDFSNNAGLSFNVDTKIYELPSANVYVKSTQIAVNPKGGNVCIIWSDNRNGNYDLYCVRVASGTVRPSKPALNWLRSQMGSFGIIDSYENDNKAVGWLYDQALAIFAFTKAGDIQNAQKVLNALKSIQNLDGSWYFSYYTNGQNAASDYAKYVGSNAWAVIAMCYYTYITADRQFIPMIDKAASWLATYMDNNPQSPTFGSLSGGEKNNIPITWRSTEHNIASFAAFRYLHDITANVDYLNKANLIKRYLMFKMWNKTRFLTGWADTSEFLDVNSWAVLALGPKPNGLDIAPCLQWAYDNLSIYDNWDAAITNIHGFDENKSYNLPLDKVWSEGSEGMAAGYYRIGNIAYAKYFHNQTYKYQQSNGGVPYATPNNDGADWPQYNSVAGTAWFYFNECNPPFNPLDPYLAQGGTNALSLDDFSDATPNLNSLGYITSDDGTCSVNIDVGEAHQLSWTNNTAYWYSNLWNPVSGVYTDVSGFINLTFSIKGAAGNEKFVVRLQDKDDKRADVNIASYASVTTSWQEVDIPLRDFLLKGIDIKNLKAISLCFLNDTSGTIYIDNIKFSGMQQPPVADAGADKIITLGNSVTFDASGSFDDGIIVSYGWELGDGTVKSGKTITHTYQASGNYTVVLRVTDNTGLTGSDFAIAAVRQSSGNEAPVINNIAPENGTLFQTGDAVSILITASDLDFDVLQYQFSIDGQVKQAWGASALYNWATTSSDKGRHTIKCEVRDNQGGAATKEIYLTGFRRALGPPSR
jgi:hypothetical protein